MPAFRSRTNGSVRAPLSSSGIRFDASDENATFDPSPLIEGAAEPPSAALGATGGTGPPPRATGGGDASAAPGGIRLGTPGGQISDEGLKKCPKSAWWNWLVNASQLR